MRTKFWCQKGCNCAKVLTFFHARMIAPMRNAAIIGLGKNIGNLVVDQIALWSASILQQRSLDLLSSQKCTMHEPSCSVPTSESSLKKSLLICRGSRQSPSSVPATHSWIQRSTWCLNRTATCSNRAPCWLIPTIMEKNYACSSTSNTAPRMPVPTTPANAARPRASSSSKALKLCLPQRVSAVSSSIAKLQG